MNLPAHGRGFPAGYYRSYCVHPVLAGGHVPAKRRTLKRLVARWELASETDPLCQRGLARMGLEFEQYEEIDRRGHQIFSLNSMASETRSIT
jgi:hypothetical protein